MSISDLEISEEVGRGVNSGVAPNSLRQILLSVHIPTTWVIVIVEQKEIKFLQLGSIHSMKIIIRSLYVFLSGN